MARKWTNETIDVWISEHNKTFVRFSDTTAIKQPSTTPISWKCLVDGHVWNARVDNVVGKGSSCPKCSGNIELTVEEVNDRLAATSNATCISIHPGSRQRARTATFECHKCGQEWNALVHNVLTHGYGCPTCNANMSIRCSSSDGEHFHSKLEREFWEATTSVREKGIIVLRQVPYVHTRKFTCDFYLPHLRLMIEISGKALLKRDSYLSTINTKRLIAEARHAHIEVLSTSTEIQNFVNTLETCFT